MSRTLHPLCLPIAGICVINVPQTAQAEQVLSEVIVTSDAAAEDQHGSLTVPSTTQATTDI